MSLQPRDELVICNPAKTTVPSVNLNKFIQQMTIHGLYIYPQFFSKQSKCFLKVAIVSQLINGIGKLFHTSIILTVKKFPNIQMHLWFVDFECVASQSCT